jgi:hypothetical protein
MGFLRVCRRENTNDADCSPRGDIVNAPTGRARQTTRNCRPKVRRVGTGRTRRMQISVRVGVREESGAGRYDRISAFSRMGTPAGGIHSDGKPPLPTIPILVCRGGEVNDLLRRSAGAGCVEPSSAMTHLVLCAKAPLPGLDRTSARDPTLTRGAIDRRPCRG